MVFLMGPRGVGKSTVAKSLAGDEVRYLSDDKVLELLNTHARERVWDQALVEASSVVIECPCFLERRPSAFRALQDFIRARSGGGRHTFVCEAESGTPMEDLMAAVHPGYRATVVLRFPIGRGRKRFALRVCHELGVSMEYARDTEHIDPWTYAAVREAISTRS